VRAPDRLAGGFFGALCAGALGALACSDATRAGFEGDAAAARDVAAPAEPSTGEPDATGLANDTAPTRDEGSAAGDESAPVEASPTLDSGSSSGAGDGSTASLCAKLCVGCCDATGQCRAGDTMAICGAKGAACDDCAMHKCTTLTEAPCCGTKGCGCAIAGLLGCN
jgi:hypothetical protein